MWVAFIFRLTLVSDYSRGFYIHIGMSFSVVSEARDSTPLPVTPQAGGLDNSSGRSLSCHRAVSESTPTEHK